MITLILNQLIFVPFEYLGGNDWIKRDDLPRFKEIEEVRKWRDLHPEHNFREGKPVPICWVESDRLDFYHEWLRGVGTPEWLSIQKP